MHAEPDSLSEFPSVLSEGPTEVSSYQAALFHLRQGLQALANLSPGTDADKQQAHEDLLSLQTQVLQLLHIHFAPDGETAGVRRFGDVLRQHRDEAALCTVPELKLVPSEITSVSTVRENSHRLAPNWFVPPSFDSVQMMSELTHQLNSNGGSLEQTYVYLDHKSALDWIQLCNTPGYTAAFRDRMPHSAIARRIAELVGPVGLDLIALGPGDGQTEVRLVQSTSASRS